MRGFNFLKIGGKNSLNKSKIGGKNSLNKRGQMDKVIRIILTVIFFVILSAGVYFLVNFLKGS